MYFILGDIGLNVGLYHDLLRSMSQLSIILINICAFLVYIAIVNVPPLPEISEKPVHFVETWAVLPSNSLYLDARRYSIALAG